jgi:hypothetical protein
LAVLPVTCILSLAASRARRNALGFWRSCEK